MSLPASTFTSKSSTVVARVDINVIVHVVNVYVDGHVDAHVSSCKNAHMQIKLDVDVHTKRLNFIQIKLNKPEINKPWINKRFKVSVRN